ncbi:hypothetical protein Tco_0720807 [Tanacetum coccineum]
MIGHDQTKINVMQIFHGVVNQVHVDYASLLWSDFLYYVMQSKKTAIQYPRFTKVIIYDLIEKYQSILKRLDEEYYTIKDDTPLVNIYTTRRVVPVSWRVGPARSHSVLWSSERNTSVAALCCWVVRLSLVAVLSYRLASRWVAGRWLVGALSGCAQDENVGGMLGAFGRGSHRSYVSALSIAVFLPAMRISLVAVGDTSVELGFCGCKQGRGLRRPIWVGCSWNGGRVTEKGVSSATYYSSSKSERSLCIYVGSVARKLVVELASPLLIYIYHESLFFEIIVISSEPRPTSTLSSLRGVLLRVVLSSVVPTLLGPPFIKPLPWVRAHTACSIVSVNGMRTIGLVTAETG